MNENNDKQKELESLDNFEENQQHASIFNDLKHQEIKDNEIPSQEDTELEEDLKNLDEFDEDALNKNEPNLAIHDNSE